MESIIFLSWSQRASVSSTSEPIANLLANLGINSELRDYKIFKFRTSFVNKKCCIDGAITVELTTDL